MASSKSSLDHATLTVLVELAQARLPAGHPVTLAAVETAVMQLLRDIGPQVAAATLTGDLTDPAQPRRGKKGGRRRAPAGR
jgi:hypothetical protein